MESLSTLSIWLQALQALVGKRYYALTAVYIEPDPASNEKYRGSLSIFINSWKQFSPETRLAIFFNGAERWSCLDDPAVEVIPFKLPKNSSLSVKYLR